MEFSRFINVGPIMNSFVNVCLFEPLYNLRFLRLCLYKRDILPCFYAHVVEMGAGARRGGARNQEEFWGSTHFARCVTPAARWRFRKISIPAGNNGKNTWTVCVYIIMEKLYAVQGYGMYSVYWLWWNMDRLDYTAQTGRWSQQSTLYLCKSPFHK